MRFLQQTFLFIIFISISVQSLNQQTILKAVNISIEQTLVLQWKHTFYWSWHYHPNLFITSWKLFDVVHFFRVTTFWNQFRKMRKVWKYFGKLRDIENIKPLLLEMLAFFQSMWISSWYADGIQTFNTYSCDV